MQGIIYKVARYIKTQIDMKGMAITKPYILKH